MRYDKGESNGWQSLQFKKRKLSKPRNKKWGLYPFYAADIRSIIRSA